MRPHSFQDILLLLPDARPNGNGYVASCPLPGHDTPKDHLTVKDSGDKVLVYCHGGKHKYEDYLQAWGFDSLNYSGDGMGGHTTIGKACEPVNTPVKHAQKGLTPPLLTSVNAVSAVTAAAPAAHAAATPTPPAATAPATAPGVTLDALAKAKCIPVDYLKGLGISDFKYSGQAAVKIPYYGEDGKEIAIRFRLAITGDKRFKWRKGDKANPYGLNRLEFIKKTGWVLIVEGESDCWTCWLHGIPALGAPGKGIWPVSWGQYLKGLEVYVWQEPDAEDFTLRLLASAPDLRYIQAPDGIKDISEAHIQGYDVPLWLEELKSTAEFGKAEKAKHDDKRLLQIYNEAKAIIEAEDPLELIKGAIRSLGYGGDIGPAIVVYLAATSRLLAMRDGAMPVHLLITGVSSSGKSYTLRLVLILFPEEAYHVIDAGSPRTIIYDDTDLQYKVLVFAEADSLPAGEDNPAASAIRNLLQDHCLHYEVTVRNAETGEYSVRKVVKSGPTVLITTSTKSLGFQLMTRLFSLEIGNSKEQIEAALKTQAAIEIEGSKPLDCALVAFQAYLQLRTPFRVIVPYVGELANGMAKMASAPRILRDFARLLSLIKSVAVIRHHHRQTDAEGRILAELTDYETVRALVNDMYVDSSTGATSDIRQLVDAVKEIGVKNNSGKITNSVLAKHLGSGVMQVTRWAKKAMANDWLINNEQRKYHPADYSPGEPMPEVTGLPILVEVNTANTVNNEPVNDFSLKKAVVNTLTPLTDGSTPFPHSDHPGTVPTLPDYPVEPCYICGCGDYWLRDASQWGVAGWLCSKCHPILEGD